MNATYLIYPVILSQSEMNLIKCHILAMQDEVILPLTGKTIYPDRLREMCSNATKNMKEIISNENSEGYRYNSYCLNMICLKLTYCYELMKKYDPEILKPQMSQIAHINYSISLILCTSHNKYIDSFG